jgi:hypothetical protein
MPAHGTHTYVLGNFQQIKWLRAPASTSKSSCTQTSYHPCVVARDIPRGTRAQLKRTSGHGRYGDTRAGGEETEDCSIDREIINSKCLDRDHLHEECMQASCARSIIPIPIDRPITACWRRRGTWCAGRARPPRRWPSS